MTDLVMPSDEARVPPLRPDKANAYVRGAYDLSVRTWGIPNNLAQTMGWLPRLVQSEVEYANSFIFDDGFRARWPDPAPGSTRQISYPEAGFVDRVTKELCINLVSLLNRSRYSITHHSFIAYSTLKGELASGGGDPARDAEAMLLGLVDGGGNPTFRGKDASAPYTVFNLAALDFALAVHAGAHTVDDGAFAALRAAVEAEASVRFAADLAACPDEPATEALHRSFVNSMIVELSWLIVHFNGLLNEWFTLLRVSDEVDEKIDGIDFVSAYNAAVPEAIKVRNNALLGTSGWGG